MCARVCSYLVFITKTVGITLYTNYRHLHVIFIKTNYNSADMNVSIVYTGCLCKDATRRYLFCGEDEMKRESSDVIGEYWVNCIYLVARV